MDILLEDLTLKAKKKMFKKIIKGLEAYVENDDSEENYNWTLMTLIEMLDNGDGQDAFGTEGWQHSFGVSS